MSRAGFDISYRYGEPFEKAFGNLLLRAKVEVKRDQKFLSTGNLCVEFEQWHPQDRSVKVPSGIGVTEADFWAFVLDDDLASALVPIEKLRMLCQRFAECTVMTGDNGNRSYLIPLAAVFPGMRYLPPKSNNAPSPV